MTGEEANAGARDVAEAPARDHDLTVVIVNYNVRFFLEQCLYSVAVAARGLRVETIVVDNDSRDSSLGMLRGRTDVTLIENRVNVGFAKANNQGIRRARGRYVLLLNPDTLVPEDAFRKCLAYCDANADVGALGVRMVDGSGAYLPESKRGLPTPWVSFTKMTGLSRLAPASARYNGYYLGHLSATATNDVDVLPGAFMWLRPEAVAAAGGGLDEDYFMYGEDIDLSYVIQRAGFRVVYFPEVTIVHYKGESTRKRSWRYVQAFYRAMAIFSRKHLRQGSAAAQPLLDLAIYARAALAVVTNAAVALLPALVDAAIMLALLLGLRDWWATFYFADPGYYDDTDFEIVNVPLYTVLWVLGLYLSGAYDRPFRLWAALRGLAVGTALALIAYALLPAEYHTSRALLLFTAGASVVALSAWRLAWSVLRPGDVSLTRDKVGRERRLAVVGTAADASHVLGLLGRAGVGRQYFGRVAVGRMAVGQADADAAVAVGGGGGGRGSDSGHVIGEAHAEGEVIGVVADLPALVRAYDIDELVFGLGSVGVGGLLGLMPALGTRVDYRTTCPGAPAIVGSPSRDAPGESYALLRPYALATATARRAKRTLDVAVALALVLCPFLALACERPRSALANAVAVLLGGLTWVGYAGTGGEGANWPRLRPGVLPQGLPTEDAPDVRGAQRGDAHYARYWRWGDDARAIWRGRRALGRAPLALQTVAPPRWPSRRVASRPRS